jgi:hypothetical protein
MNRPSRRTTPFSQASATLIPESSTSPTRLIAASVATIVVSANPAADWSSAATAESTIATHQPNQAIAGMRRVAFAAISPAASGFSGALALLTTPFTNFRPPSAAPRTAFIG